MSVRASSMQPSSLSGLFLLENILWQAYSKDLLTAVALNSFILIQETSAERHSLKTYWKHLSAVVIGCTSLFLFDLCERGTHLVNPFYSLWATPVGTKLALALIIAAGISASLYFVFLSWMVWRVFRNISTKRNALPTMSAVRRLHYQGN